MCGQEIAMDLFNYQQQVITNFIATYKRELFKYLQYSTLASMKLFGDRHAYNLQVVSKLRITAIQINGVQPGLLLHTHQLVGAQLVLDCFPEY